MVGNDKLKFPIINCKYYLQICQYTSPENNERNAIIKSKKKEKLNSKMLK